MTTLSSQRVCGVVDRLFREAEESMGTFQPERAALRAQGFELGSPEFDAAVRKAYLAIDAETGWLLYLLTRTRSPQIAVEFGSSFGVSTIHLAAALRDNGSGRLITTEVEPTKVAGTRDNLIQAGLDDLVEILEGDALKTLAERRPGPVDLLFLDGWNHLYLEVLQLVAPDLSPGALIVADNADAPGYRDYIRAQDRFVSIATKDRVEVTLLADPQ